MTEQDSQDSQDSQDRPEQNMSVGDDILYDPAHGKGFGASALADSSGGTAEISAEMNELDLQPGTTVRYLADDEDSSWPIIEWTDAKGLNRITTIEPGTFSSDFHPL